MLSAPGVLAQLGWGGVFDNDGNSGCSGMNPNITVVNLEMGSRKHVRVPAEHEGQPPNHLTLVLRLYTILLASLFVCTHPNRIHASMTTMLLLLRCLLSMHFIGECR